ncbi:acetoin utilization AcuB family protein [Sporosarcina cyprini]|uniref:acetoin utilization AcuB family protein n=1 Tax=Sporosarcina cyprini TaxID=2910523 RepID=UPI001EE07797|nr:acetoin utilization AcuB family protein [Sporosarcina cyprini]MCG3089438.1 acetoin utilization AcuB family protein [Sporosarcina cyprini]
MLVEEIMKKEVVTLTTAHTVRDALQIMRDHKIRHLPILDEEQLVGVVSDRDLKEAAPTLLAEIEQHPLDLPLTNIMTSNPITGHPMDFVEESAVLFYENQIGCLPIVSGGKLVGIITETDLLYNYIELTGAHQPGSQIEVRVPNVPGILFEVSKVFHEQNTNVLSVLVYPDKENEDHKILVIRIKTMNPLQTIQGLKESGFEVLWPNFPGAKQ